MEKTWHEVLSERQAIHESIRVMSCDGTMQYEELDRCKQSIESSSIKLATLACLTEGEKLDDWTNRTDLVPIEVDALLDELEAAWNRTLGPLYELIVDLVRPLAEESVRQRRDVDSLTQKLVCEFLLALEPHERLWNALREEVRVPVPGEQCPYCSSVNIDAREGRCKRLPHIDQMP